VDSVGNWLFQLSTLSTARLNPRDVRHASFR
jgi:hypothetical protein